MLLFHKQLCLEQTNISPENKTKQIPLQPQQDYSETSPTSPLEIFTEMPPNHHNISRPLRKAGKFQPGLFFLHLEHTHTHTHKKK